MINRFLCSSCREWFLIAAKLGCNFRRNQDKLFFSRGLKINSFEVIVSIILTDWCYLKQLRTKRISIKINHTHCFEAMTHILIFFVNNFKVTWGPHDGADEIWNRYLWRKSHFYYKYQTLLLKFSVIVQIYYSY